MKQQLADALGPFRRTGRAVLGITVAYAVIAGLSASSLPQAPTPVPAVAVEESNPVAEAITTVRTELDEAITEAEEATGEKVAGEVETDKLTALKEDVASAITTADTMLPRESAETLGLITGVGPFETEANAVSEVTDAGDARTTAIADAVTAWEDELEAEKERIRIAKAKAKAEAEARARAAAAAAANARHYSAAPARSGESATARINRLARSLPFHVPYTFGSCSISPIACYNVGGGIVVNPSLGGQRDCRIVYTIAHEYKHLLQFNAGQIKINSAGQITNRGWLEADAQQFGYRYGCRP